MTLFCIHIIQYSLHYFFRFLAHCALTNHQWWYTKVTKKSSFFLPKFMALVSRKISLFTLFFGISKKKYNVAKKKKTKDLMWILWKKPVWSSILNDPAWWRAFHNKPIFEKNVQQFRELYIVCLKTLFRNIRYMLDEMIMQNAITWFFCFSKILQIIYCTIFLFSANCCCWNWK